MVVWTTVRIDLNKPKKTIVPCVQTDTTQKIDVYLFSNGTPYDVYADVDLDVTVTMAVAYILPNGFGDQYTQTSNGWSACAQDLDTRNLYHITIDGAVTAMHGFVDVIVKFSTGDGQILNSFPITLDVIRSEGEDVDPDGQPSATSRYVRADLQTPATSEMTQPVGYDAETGQLVTTPGGGGGGGGVSDPVRYNTTQNLTDTQKSRARTNIGAGTGTYSKPSGGIPKTDLESAVQTSLGKADTALQSVTAANVLDAAENFNASQQTMMRGYIGAGTYSKPSGGIPKTDLAAAVQTSLGNADSALQSVEAADVLDAAGDFNAIQAALFRGYIQADEDGAAAAVQSDLDAVKAKIPAAASASNQLADKAWVLQQGGGGGGGTAPQTIIAVVDTSSSPTVTLTDLSGNGLSYSAVQSMVQTGPVSLVVYTDQYHYAGFNWHFSTFNGQPYPSTKSLTLFAIIPDSPNPSIYIANLEEDGNGILTGPMTYQTIGTGDAMNPSVVNKTAANAQTGFTVSANFEYKVSGNPTALKITNSSAVNGWWRVVLTTGSSVASENSLVLPSWCYCNETALEANTRYEFICSDDGNVAVGKWSTS